MSYERLTDEESRARVAAIIAAAESLATDEVRPARASSPVGRSGAGHRRWAVALGVGAIVLAGLAIWNQTSQDVTPEQTEPPAVLVAGDLEPTTTTPGAATTVGGADGGTPTTTGTTTPETVASTEVPTTTAPPTTPPPPPTSPGTESPHLVNDPAIESYATYADGTLSLNGRVPDQATADGMAARLHEFLPVATLDSGLQVDPAARPPIPIIVLPSDSVWDGDSATVRIDFSPQIVQMANLMLSRTTIALEIYVHTDDHAPAEETSQQTTLQAESLQAILVARGVDSSRITLFPKGAGEPLGDSTTPEGRAADRRVELVVKGLYD